MTTRDLIDQAMLASQALTAQLALAYDSAVKDEILIEDLTRRLDACEHPRPIPTRPLIGVNQGGFADFKLIGGPVEVVRVFDVGNWEADVRIHLEAKRTVILSVKSDANQARAAQLFSNEGVWLARMHEPDAKGISKEEWRQDQLRLATLNGAFKLLPITTAAGFIEWVTQALLDDIPYDGVGFDAYLRAVKWNPQGFDVNMRPCLAHAETLNLPALVCEFGVPTKVGTNVSDPQDQAEEVAKAMGYADRYDVAAYCYFNESVTKDTTRDYRLNTRPLALAELQGAAT